MAAGVSVDCRIGYTILVLSGKGGVGKSTLTCLLALKLAADGHKVAVLDTDLCGPSIPRLLGVHGAKVLQDEHGWKPVRTRGATSVLVMSIGFFLDREDDPIVWRGPKKTSMVSQLLREVNWGQIDYLLVDTPPGTSDEHISVVEAVGSHVRRGAVVVSTPQLVALNDVRREITFCRQLALPVLGLVENMSGFSCPHCKECTNVFSSQGGKGLAEEMEVPFLGTLPLLLHLSEGADREMGMDLKETRVENELALIVENLYASILKTENK